MSERNQMIIERNWRDQIPYMGHIAAIIWPFYRAEDSENPAEIARLKVMNSFVKHGLQGRQQSDHHHHTNIEQMYYILRGSGQMLLGDEKHSIREGDAVYVPVNLPHQAFNESDEWMEHLIVSCPLSEVERGTPTIQNWRDAPVQSDQEHLATWPLLCKQGVGSVEDGGVLQRMDSVSRHSVTSTDARPQMLSNDMEQVHYFISGRGYVASENENHDVMEGSAVHVPPGVPHSLICKGSDPLTLVTFSAAVGTEG